MVRGSHIIAADIDVNIPEKKFFDQKTESSINPVNIPLATV